MSRETDTAEFKAEALRTTADRPLRRGQPRRVAGRLGARRAQVLRVRVPRPGRPRPVRGPRPDGAGWPRRSNRSTPSPGHDPAAIDTDG